MSESAHFSVTLHDEAATAALMADLGLLLGAGTLITLSGELGAGKSAAARTLIRYFAGDPDLEVPSPTFTLTQTYDLAPFPVVHADLYRIRGADDLDEIGLLPLPEDAVVLVEWPERAPQAWPADRIDIMLTHPSEADATSRTIDIAGHGKASAIVRRLKDLREFLDNADFQGAERQRMAGDASTRSYARLWRDGASVILMNAPQRPDGPAIYGGKSYSAAVHLAENVTPFVAIANGLRERGFSAPEIHHTDLTHGFLITEDLGGALVVDGEPAAPIPECYRAATDVLARLHSLELPAELAVTPEIVYLIPDFDTDALMVEVGLMPEWYLADRGAALSAADHAMFRQLWRDTLKRYENTPRTWVIRDYHSPNLIWLSAREATDRVGIIDFQDTVRGAPPYDLVSLLQDARIDVPEALELQLLSYYIVARRAADPAFDAGAFAELYAVMSVQRNTRLLGTFARLNRRDGKPQYLRHQPRIWTYLRRSLAHPALAQMRAWYDRHVPPPQTT